MLFLFNVLMSLIAGRLRARLLGQLRGDRGVFKKAPVPFVCLFVFLLVLVVFIVIVYCGLVFCYFYFFV